ncbi:hypothetical protein ACQ4PT_067889 [Festuca glaucescens]
MPPDPHLRPFLAEPPNYANDETLFSVVVQHNGFFCGLNENLCYIQAAVEHWDDCSTDTWSIHWIDELLGQKGYERDGRMHVYWCPPGKDVADGLVCIEKDADIVAMCTAVSYEKSLVLMIDQTNFLKTLRDDVIIHGSPPLPPVLSPRKKAPMVIVVADEGTSSRASNGGETFEDFRRAEEDEDSDDSEWWDSDYEAADGDDDLFTENVDKEVKDNNEPEEVADLEDDGALEDGDLQFRADVQEHLKNTFSTFNAEVDMTNPEFKVGMIFSGVKEFRQALQNYSIKRRVKVNNIRNDPMRVEAICKPRCSWQIKGSCDSRYGAFSVKTYTKKHTCNYILEAREMPMLSMLETVFYKMITIKKGHANYILSQQAEQEQNVWEEDGDDPSILEHITPQHAIPQMDPMHQTNSMVYRMGQEDRAIAPQRRA